MHEARLLAVRGVAALVLAAPAALGGCGGGGSSGQLVRSTKARVVAPQLGDGDLAQLAADNDRFAVDLYRTVRSSPGNMIFSPASISIALAMTFGGAAGATAEQMAAALHFSLPPARLHPAFDALDLALTAPPATSGGFQLDLASAVWAQRGFAILPAYLDLLAQDYGAGVRLVDFAGATEAARQSINQWVSDQTAGKIPQLLMTGILGADTRLVLTNAVYFKADWEAPFDAQSPLGTFDAPSGPVSVPMMRGQSQFPIWTGPGYAATALPYAGGTTSMLVIVPDAGTFDAFEGALTADELATIVAGVAAAIPGEVVLPRFAFQQRFSLEQALEALGMVDAFSSAADFSGIDGARDLVIADVVHQADIAVDEKGTEAAAATAVVIRKASAPLNSLVVDRPFIFLIRDDATGSTLFMGRVLDPSA